MLSALLIAPMSEPTLLKSVSGACIACKQLKRKCNRALPECSTCLRVSRVCQYNRDPVIPPTQKTPRRSPLTSETADSISDGTDGGLAPRRFESEHFAASFGTGLLAKGSLHDDTLQKSTVEAVICRDTTEVLRGFGKVTATSAKYFDTLSNRMPFVWKARFNSRLHSLYNNPHADFTLLCLCISFVVQYPPKHGGSVQTSLYTKIKSHIGLLEATGFLSLDFVQARLLVAVYEMGHGLYPAASISMGACARTARALGLNKKRWGTSFSDDFARQRAEEEKRVWWEIVNLDRFINLSTGDALFATEDPCPEDILPVSDKNEWEEHSFLHETYTSLSTSASIPVSPFARECQIAHLMSRVLRHVYTPLSSPNPTFHTQEYAQLEKTLMAFFSLLSQEQTGYVDYCAALSMCGCSLFLLYDSEILLNRHDEGLVKTLLGFMEATSDHLVEISTMLFTPIEKARLDLVSPFILYCFYQAAAVQLRLFRISKLDINLERLNVLKTLLGHFNTRWRVAGIYLDALDNRDVGFPITMFSLQGGAVSARGPQSQISRS